MALYTHARRFHAGLLVPSQKLVQSQLRLTLLLHHQLLLVYSVEGTDLCLACTIEILMEGLYVDRILAEKQLPLKLVAFSHCFQTEAGAASSVTRLMATDIKCIKLYRLSKPPPEHTLSS